MNISSEEYASMGKLQEIIVTAMTYSTPVLKATLETIPSTKMGLSEKHMMAAAMFFYLEYHTYKMLKKAGLTINGLQAFRFSVMSMVLGMDYAQEEDVRDFIKDMYASEKTQVQIEDILANIENKIAGGDINKQEPEMVKFSEILSDFQKTWDEFVKDKEKRSSR